MKTAVTILAAMGLSFTAFACNAGVAPTQDSSHLTQSGAKIAPAHASADSAKKDEKEKDEREKEQDKAEKR